MIAVRLNPDLYQHLSTFDVDGATVESALFDGGRLSYPGRKRLETELGFIEPYTLAHEARVIEGLRPEVVRAIRVLSRFARWVPNDDWSDKIDPTLELLWVTHEAWDTNTQGAKGVSLDRLVAALVGVNFAMNNKQKDEIENAAVLLIRELHVLGFPPTEEGLEELFDGAEPACAALGLVDITP